MINRKGTSSGGISFRFSSMGGSSPSATAVSALLLRFGVQVLGVQGSGYLLHRKVQRVSLWQAAGFRVCDLEVSKKKRVPYSGVHIIRILLFRVLHLI